MGIRINPAFCEPEVVSYESDGVESSRDLRFETLPTPKPAKDQVLVRVTHSGICGTDLKIYHGRHSGPLSHDHGPRSDRCRGRKQHDRIRPGDRVMVDPALACGNCPICQAGFPNVCPNGGLIGRDVNGGFAEYLVAPCRRYFLCRTLSTAGRSR